MIKALKEKIRELQADEDFMKSLRKDFQSALATGIFLLALIVFISLSGKGCAVQDLDSKTGDPGDYPTQKVEASSITQNEAPSPPTSESKGAGK